MIQDRYNLTRGNILPQLFKVSLPVMLTSLMQMAYNLTDLFWLGNATADETVNNGYVASAGFGGFFIWLGAAVFILVKIGTEVRVAQSMGRRDEDAARIYARTGVQLEFIFALIYSVILFFGASTFMKFYPMEPVNYDNSILYLKIISAGMLFYLMNPVFTATLNGIGNTKTPFYISSIGLILNMILDPIFIKVLHWDIQGAAYATIISQFTVSIGFIIYFYSKHTLLSKAKFFNGIDREKAKDILRLGLPVAIQSALFTIISMYIGRMVAISDTSENDAANAVQKIGGQIESLSWLIAGGFQTAIGAFVGQNYGAKQPRRVLKGVRYSLVTMTIYGIIISIVMYVFAGPIFGIFLRNKEALTLGIDYLKILAFSQLFMIIEALVGGALNGLGKTVPQSINSLALNAIRIPLAYVLIPHFGLNGIWLAITISSILKGVVIYVYYKLYIRKSEMFKNVDLSNNLSNDTIMI